MTVTDTHTTTLDEEQASERFAELVARLSRQSVAKHFDAYVDVDWDNPDWAIDPTDPRWELPPDSPLGATMGALAVLVTSSLLFTLDAASPIAPYLPTRYWLAFVDLFRDPILWRDLTRGLALQGVYVGVLLAAAWANFTTKDVTS